MLDWNQVLRMANSQMDEVVQHYQKGTWQDREAAIDAFNAQVAASQAQAESEGDNALAPRPAETREAYTQRVGQWILDSVASSYGRINERLEQAIFVTKVARIAVAAAAYRADVGQWPEKLQELVPAYATAIPADMYTGKPLTYVRGAGGICIYSVGKNGEDDGGVDNSRLGLDDLGVGVPAELVP
jgi:hypothetical protein